MVQWFMVQEVNDYRKQDMIRNSLIITLVLFIQFIYARKYGSDHKVNTDIFSSYKYVFYSPMNSSENYMERLVLNKALEVGFEIVENSQIDSATEEIKLKTLEIKWRVTNTNTRGLGAYSQEVTVEFRDHISKKVIYFGVGESIGVTSAGDKKKGNKTCFERNNRI